MAAWHHPLNGHEPEQDLGGAEGQGSLRAAVHGIVKCWTRLTEQRMYIYS